MCNKTRQLLIGFDSAWGEQAKGYMTAALLNSDGVLDFVLPPTPVCWQDALITVSKLYTETHATRVSIFVDQPVVVANKTGQRPVEKMISSIIGKLAGGVQAAYLDHKLHSATSKLQQFISDCQQHFECQIVETYPALSIAACGWLINDQSTGKVRLPKYNPTRKTFAIEDWQFICEKLASEFVSLELHEPSRIAAKLRPSPSPNKAQQDQIDSLICLFNAIYHYKFERSMLIGRPEDGQICVPYSEKLANKLRARCEAIDLDPQLYVRAQNKRNASETHTQPFIDTAQPESEHHAITPEDFREYYRELNNRELSNIQAFDKAILTLASSGLALTAAFHENFITADAPALFTWVKATWLFFVTSIISVIISFLSANRAIKFAKEHFEGLAFGKPDKDLEWRLDNWSRTTSIANLASALLFISAIICFTTYVWINS